MQKPVILLVEDNPDDEALTLRAIKKHNIACDVITARDGEEALDYLNGVQRSASRKPAFILLDLKLPKISGLQVLERIRSEKTTQMIPVIIMTSSNEEQDLQQSYRLGANSYIAKPVDYTELVESIRLVTHYWLEINTPPSK